MKEPPDTKLYWVAPISLLQEELLQVLPEGTRLVDSGAAIARRTARLLEHEAPDAKSADANIAFCMAMTPEAEQLLPFYSVTASKRSKTGSFKIDLVECCAVRKLF